MAQDARQRMVRLLAAGLLATTIVAAYLPLSSAGFINYDDPEYVVDNPHVNTGLSWSNIAWAFTHRHSANWHPLTWISHMADVRMFGLHPGGHHLTSLLLHIVNTVLVLYLLALMTGAFWRSFMVAALFALHPLHVESVAWIAERKDVLCAFFALLTLIAYAKYAHRPRASVYAGALVLYACALMSKPMAVTLPVLMLLLDFWPLRRIAGSAGAQESGAMPVRQLIAEKAPLLALALASGAVTIWAQAGTSAIIAIDKIPPLARMANAVISYVAYGADMLRPTRLSVFYPYPFPISIEQVALCCAILIICSAAAIILIKKAPWVIVGWCWYLVSLLPVIGLMQVGAQARADRYTYLPLIGLFIVVVWSIEVVVRKRQFGAPAAFAMGAAAIVVCAFLTWRQAGFWKNSMALFEHALAMTGDTPLAHGIIGGELDKSGNPSAAAAHFSAALSGNPGNHTILINLGCAFGDMGKHRDAMACFGAVLLRRPYDVDALVNMGSAWLHLDRPDSAALWFRRAIAADPAYAGARYNLGLALAAIGQTDSAASHYRKALNLKPDYWQAAMNMGLLMRKAGNHAEAIAAFSRVLAILPDNPKALILRGESYAATGDRAAAIADYQRVISRNPGLGEIRERIDSLKNGIF
jgi:tetratricopeptide (TPR) repeat protein